MSYNNPIPCAICIVRVKNVEGKINLLALSRNIQPGKGLIALPGGYIDELESINDALSRELLEETGLVLDKNDWVLFDNKIAVTNKLLIFAYHKDILEEKQINFEFNNIEVQFLKLIDVNHTEKIAFIFHNEIIAKFFKEIINC